MTSKILQRLLDEVPRGQPLDPEILRDMGIGPQRITYLVGAGWLVRLSKGAYLLRGDRATAEGITAYLARRVPRLHIGGLTAIDRLWDRLRRPALGEIDFWAVRPYAIPDWVGHYISWSFQTTSLFHEDTPPLLGLKPLHETSHAVLVSSSERALLELLSDIGKKGKPVQSIDRVVEILHRNEAIKPEALDQLLTHCNRVKVVRSAQDLSHRMRGAWDIDFQRHLSRLGGLV